MLADGFGARHLRSRWVVSAELVLVTAASVGRGDTGPADLAVLRDRTSGRPLVTGTSLAGALRAHLTDRLAGYWKHETDTAVATLFGARRGYRDREGTWVAGEEDAAQSPLITFDALARPPADTTEVRDGVAIDAGRGTAEDHHKFDLELLPAGTTIPVRVELLVAEEADEAALVSLLVATLDGLAPGSIAMGSRKSRGLGQVRTEGWRARRHDLRSAPGWLDWLTSGWPDLDGEGEGDGHPDLAGVEPQGSSAAAVLRAMPTLALATVARRDHARRVTARATLALRAGLLVRSPGSEPGAPDHVHLRSAGKPVLPGTSLAGALRNRALRIARLARKAPGKAEELVDGLFGPRPTSAAKDKAPALQASRLRVSETVVAADTRPVRTTRIQLDRVTQGVVKGAMLEEEIQYGGQLEVTMEILDPHPGEEGLLVMLLKDLVTSDLAVGGSTAVGRGVLSGTASIRLAGGADIQLETGAEPGDAVQQAIDDLWQP